MCSKCNQLIWMLCTTGEWTFFEKQQKKPHKRWFFNFGGCVYCFWWMLTKKIQLNPIEMTLWFPNVFFNLTLQAYKVLNINNRVTMSSILLHFFIFSFPTTSLHHSQFAAKISLQSLFPILFLKWLSTFSKGIARKWINFSIE